MADHRLSDRLRAVVRAFRDPGARPAAAPSLHALEQPIGDVMATHAAFELVGWHLQDVADAGRAPTARELLAHGHLAAELGRAVDRLGGTYGKAMGWGGAP